MSALLFMGCYMLAQVSKEAEGVWMARGYGWVIEVDSEKIRIYDLSQVACFPSEEYPIALFEGGISVDQEVLMLQRGVTQYKFDRIEILPPLCKKKLSKKALKNPVLNFEILWNTFYEQYAYFQERKVDWQAMYDTYRKRVNEKTSEAELFAICDAMLAELNDGHVGIEGPDRIMKKAAVIGNWDSRPDADFSGTRQAVVAKYLKKPRRHNISRTIWGKINDSIGYIQLNSMGAQGDYGIEPNTPVKEAQKLYRKYLAGNPDVFNDDINGMNRIMKEVLNDLGDTQKIILDLRFNGGGEDMVGLAALSHFISEEKTVFYKKVRVGDSFSEAYTFALSPAVTAYSGKLYLLQSHWSASAAEILLLSSMSFNNIERLGSPSEGIFSDILEKKLPNGWEFGLSNQVYQDTKGISYEAKGVPVHIDMAYPKDEYKFVEKLKNDLKTTGDAAIEYVLNKQE